MYERGGERVCTREEGERVCTREEEGESMYARGGERVCTREEGRECTKEFCLQFFVDF